MNGKRKNRSSLGRSPRGRGIERVPSVDGIYHNASFMHAITSQIGNVVKVYTHTGSVYEGILKTFSSLFEVVLELAHKIDLACPTSVPVNTVIEKIIFKPHDVIFIEVLDSETDYATRDTFQTDTAISKFNGQISEKELEPWDCTGGHADECELEANGSMNGWDVNDMFKKNEQMYGVTSTFDHALSGYTTPLQNKNSKDYKDAEAKATKIANEIESNPTYKARLDVENGDEEEKFAAVVRPADDNANPETNTNKYVCPPKRKPQPQQPPPSKPIRNIHVKIPEHKPSTSLPYYHSSVPSSSSNGSHNAMRERVNGLSEPKPQRSVPSHRPVGRPYPTSDNSRPGPGPGNSYVIPPSGAVDIKQTSQINPVSSSGNPQSYIAVPPDAPPSSLQRKPSPGVLPSPSESAPPHAQRRSSPGILTSPTEVSASHLQRKPSPSVLSSPVDVTVAHVQRKPSPSVMPPSNEVVLAHSQRKLSPGVMPPPTDLTAPHLQRKPAPSVIPSPNEVPVSHMPRKLSSGVISSPTEVPNPHGQRKLSSGVISSPTEVVPPPMQRKPAYNPPLIHPLTGEHLRTKPPRGREEHFSDLKKFSTDFHLAETPTEASKAQMVSQTHEEENSRLSSDPSVNVNAETPPSSARPLSNAPPAVPDTEKTTPPYIKSKLNPNAKEFVYNPNAKPFTPRSSTTPTQSRPHTPQTPSYGVPSVPTVPSIPAGAMVVPTYVVTTAQPHYTQPPPNQHSRYRKVQMGMPPRPDMTSQMQVAAATGQPLLPTGPIPAQFTVPYTPQPHLANQPYQQMVRMVTPQGGGMVPLVPATLNYPPDPNQPHAQHIQYMGQGAMATVPHHPHHNPYIHGNAVSPQPANNGQLGPLNGNGAAVSGANANNGTNANGHQQPYPSIHHTPHHLAPFSFTVV